MPIKIGRAKHLLRITIDDFLRHTIWVSAHDDRHDEEWFRPIDSTDGVTPEVLRINVPMITLRVVGTDFLAIGSFLNDRLYAITFYVDGKWVVADETKGLQFPVELESIPSILGTKGAHFRLANPAAQIAERIR